LWNGNRIHVFITFIVIVIIIIPLRGFESRQVLGIFLFTTAFTQPPVQWVPEALSLGVKRPGREADHSLQSGAKVKITWIYTCALADHHAMKVYWGVEV
jgi:hypothetical protein